MNKLKLDMLQVFAGSVQNVKGYETNDKVGDSLSEIFFFLVCGGKLH